MTLRQLSLYDLQLLGAPHNGTPTSIEAARQANPSSQELEVLGWLDQEGASTQDEISLVSGISRGALAARFNALERDGRIEKTGETRLTRYGRPAAVYQRKA